MNVVDSVSNVWDRLPKFKNIKNKFREMSLDLEQNKIDINENDALADKTFFAFLADLLRFLKKMINIAYYILTYRESYIIKIQCLYHINGCYCDF